MAGDWIKVEATTPDKPEVHRIAAALGLPPEHVVGSLLRVWIWADQQTIDGNALSVTEKIIDRIACVTGLASAMRQVGWLGGTDGALKLPNFSNHNGKTAKSRALTRDRVKRLRNDDGVTPALPEKRREEIEKRGKAITADQVVNFTPNGAVRDWAEKRGYAITWDLHLEHFKDYLSQERNRKRYTDIDSAFRTCLRADWGNFRERAGARTVLGPASREARIEANNLAAAQRFIERGEKKDEKS